MENISPHISYHEATYSKKAVDKGIDNTPPPGIVVAMKLVANTCFEPARLKFGAIGVNSFYRCLLLNIAVGGSKTSQHMRGEAIDMDRGSRAKNKELLEWCKANLKYDQLISEYPNEEGPNWVHISFSANGNRNQFITIK